MLKYRFLCLSIFLRMLIHVLTPTSEYYILLSQGCPLNLIHFSIMSLLLISDIMFLIDYTYYYITLDCFINVRLEKNKYYTIILKKVISGTIILFLSDYSLVIAPVVADLCTTPVALSAPPNSYQNNSQS